MSQVKPMPPRIWTAARPLAMPASPASSFAAAAERAGSPARGSAAMAAAA